MIYPESHYGRDAIVGIGLFLSLYCERNLSLSKLIETYPKYFMVKKSINLSNSINIDEVINRITKEYKNENIDCVDGVRIDFKKSWVQIRKSNTEPIIRVYSEAINKKKANDLISVIESLIKDIIN